MDRRIICVLLSFLFALSSKGQGIDNYRQYSDQLTACRKAGNIEGLRQLKEEIQDYVPEVSPELRHFYSDLALLCDAHTGYYYYGRGEYELAISFFEKASSADDVRIRVRMENALTLSMGRLATLAKLRNDYPKAIEWRLKSIVHAEIAGNTKNEALGYTDLAEYYYSIGDRERCFSYLEKAEGTDTSPQVKGKVYYFRGRIEQDAQNYGAALTWFEKAYDTQLNGSLFDAAYASAHAIASLYSGALLNEELRKRWDNMAERAKTQRSTGRQLSDDPLRERRLWNELEMSRYADAHIHLVNLYLDGRLEDADKGVVALISDLQQIDGVPDGIFAEMNTLRGCIALKDGQYDSAADYLEQSFHLSLGAPLPDYREASRAKRYLSYVRYHQNDLQGAVLAARQSLEYGEKGYGAWDTNLVDILELLANTEAYAEDFPSAKKHFRMAVEKVADNVKRNFSYLNASERAAYWDHHSEVVHFMPTFCYAMEEYYSDFTDALYDAQLLVKGLLLQSDISLQEDLGRNKELMAKMEEVKAMRSRAEQGNLTKEASEELMREALKKERDIVTRSSSLNDYMAFLNIDYRRIQDALKKNEAAIEFITFPFKKDQEVTAALLLRKDSEHVRLVPLFEARDFPAITTSLYEDGKAFSLVWAPLQPYLEGVSKVYFAPSGILNSVSIEYLPDDKGTVFTDGVSASRLTSTRYLALDPAKPGRDALVYGGIDYTAAGTTKSAASSLSGESSSRGLMHSDYLPWSLQEAEDVAGELRGHRIHTTLKTGKEATEASFMALSGAQYRYLHIATHGIFDEKGEDPLQSAALLFSGGRDALRSSTGFKVDRDGIVYAKEIATSDLRGLELVVLSACQTGLGRVTSEGVFGLQRAFKMAGAGSLLMSLWSVDDKATWLFMKEFYACFLSGKTASSSVSFARKKVAEQYPGPEYWAAFVLLDSVD